MDRRWIIDCSKCGNTEVTQNILDQLEFNEDYSENKEHACLCPKCGSQSRPNQIAETGE